MPPTLMKRDNPATSGERRPPRPGAFLAAHRAGGARLVARCAGIVMAGGALVVAILVGVAGPASAWTADATTSQTCVNGTTQSTVHFSNNFDVPATVTYSGPVSGSLGLPPMVGSTPGTNSITFAVTAPSTLTYRVRWDSGETQRDRALTIAPINDCVPASTTTAPAVSVAPTSPPTTTLPTPTTVEVLPTSVVGPPPTTAVVAAPTVAAAAPPATRASTVAPAQLPATGTDATGFEIGGVILAVAGALLIAGGRWADRR